MRVDAIPFKLESSFLSCEKDTEIILRRLFIDSRPYNKELIRLLTINTKDCLDNLNSPVYNAQIEKMTLPQLIKDGYIKLNPKFKIPESEEVKSYIVLSFDNFTPNATNPLFRDCTIHFDVLSHTDYWDIGNYRQRPLKIAGYIDAIMNHSKITGIGTVDFLTATELILDENLTGYTLTYRAVHWTDDIIPPKDDA